MHGHIFKFAITFFTSLYILQVVGSKIGVSSNELIYKTEADSQTQKTNL